MTLQSFFVSSGESILFSAPTLTHEVLLLAAGCGGTITKVKRWYYEDVMRIENVWDMQGKPAPYRIMGMHGGYVWQDIATRRQAVGEFCTRTNPYIPVPQRPLYIELVRKYRKDEILAGLNGMYGSLCERNILMQ